jgi:hypothetical protein
MFTNLSSKKFIIVSDIIAIEKGYSFLCVLSSGASLLLNQTLYQAAKNVFNDFIE